MKRQLDRDVTYSTYSLHHVSVRAWCRCLLHWAGRKKKRWCWETREWDRGEKSWDYPHPAASTERFAAPAFPFLLPGNQTSQLPCLWLISSISELTYPEYLAGKRQVVAPTPNTVVSPVTFYKKREVKQWPSVQNDSRCAASAVHTIVGG